MTGLGVMAEVAVTGQGKKFPAILHHLHGKSVTSLTGQVTEIPPIWRLESQRFLGSNRGSPCPIAAEQSLITETFSNQGHGPVQ